MHQLPIDHLYDILKFTLAVRRKRHKHTCSWLIFCYSAPIHWLVHCHMTSNNETVCNQMPWAGNIGKTMTSNRKQFTVTRKMFTAVAFNLSIMWLFVFHRFDPFALLYNKSLNDWSLGEQWLLFLLNLNVSLDLSQETARFSGNKIHCSPRDQSLLVSVYWITLYSFLLFVSSRPQFRAEFWYIESGLLKQ